MSNETPSPEAVYREALERVKAKDPLHKGLLCADCIQERVHGDGCLFDVVARALAAPVSRQPAAPAGYGPCRIGCGRWTMYNGAPEACWTCMGMADGGAGERYPDWTPSGPAAHALCKCMPRYCALRDGAVLQSGRCRENAPDAPAAQPAAPVEGARRTARRVAHEACMTPVGERGFAGCPRMPRPGEEDRLQHTDLCDRVTAAIETRDAEADRAAQPSPRCDCGDECSGRCAEARAARPSDTAAPTAGCTACGSLGLRAIHEARDMLGNALYPGFNGDSPPGTANCLWDFAKEAAARLTAPVPRDEVVAEVARWLETKADGGEREGAKDRAAGRTEDAIRCEATTFVRRLIARQLRDHSWLADLERLDSGKETT